MDLVFKNASVNAELQVQQSLISSYSRGVSISAQKEPKDQAKRKFSGDKNRSVSRFQLQSLEGLHDQINVLFNMQSGLISCDKKISKLAEALDKVALETEQHCLIKSSLATLNHYVQTIAQAHKEKSPQEDESECPEFLVSAQGGRLQRDPTFMFLCCIRGERVAKDSNQAYQPKTVIVPTMVSSKIALVFDGELKDHELQRILADGASVRNLVNSSSSSSRSTSSPTSSTSSSTSSPSSSRFGLSAASLALSSGEVTKFLSPRKVFDPGRVLARGIVVFAKSSPKSSPKSLPPILKCSRAFFYLSYFSWCCSAWFW